MRKLLESNKDFNVFVAFWRAIDITDFLGGDRMADPK